MTFKIRSQRDAIATILGWDRSEVEEYQPTRPRHPKVRLYNVGDGFGIALKDGKPVPPAIDEEMGPFTTRPSLTLAGWTVWLTKGAGK